MSYKADIVIIGAGAVGTAIARELAKYHVHVIVVDKRDDVGGDASKSNSSIICSGADCPPNTLESELCRSGRAMIEDFVKELDIPFWKCGALMPAVTQEQMDILPHIYDDAYHLNHETETVNSERGNPSIKPASGSIICKVFPDAIFLDKISLCGLRRL